MNERRVCVPSGVNYFAVNLPSDISELLEVSINPWIEFSEETYLFFLIKWLVYVEPPAYLVLFNLYTEFSNRNNFSFLIYLIWFILILRPTR